MSKEEHRDDELLLRFADGELDSKEAGQAQAHLKACWKCRTRLEDLQSAIAGYMRYRESVMKPLLPPPPQPWGSLSGRLRKIDADAAPRPRWRVPHMPPGWLAAAAALLAGVIAYRMWREPVVSAAEILRKASSADVSPSTRRRIRIKTRQRTLVRARSLDAKSRTAAQPESDGTEDLEALFAAANFSWEDPLSARSFEAWRSQLASKVDSVRTLADQASGGRLYEIRTSTAASRLTEAELTVREADWRPVHETLQFDAGEIVEISEAPDAPADPLPPVSVAASRPAPEVSDRMATAGDELRVIAALHKIGADLGEPIEVTRSKGILVAGTGLDDARKRQLQALLANLPGVTVRFDEAQQPVPDGKEDRPRDSRASTAPVGTLQLQLQSYLGSAAALQKFTDGILDASEGAMARAHALRNLAERFPQAEEHALSAADLRLLATLRAEHAAALEDLARRMVQLVQPVLKVPGKAPPVGPADSWQDRTRNVLESTRQVDRLLNQMLAGGDSDAARRHTPQELASALASLEAQLAADEVR